MSTQTFDLGGGFAFSSAGIDSIQTEKVTIVTIALDASGSMSGFEDAVVNAVLQALGACRKSPYSESFRVRLTKFQGRSVKELLGFTQLPALSDSMVPGFSANDGTPLNDATLEAISALGAEGQRIYDADLIVNGLLVVISDGGESGASRSTPSSVKAKLDEIKRAEKLESVLTILVGIDTGSSSAGDLKAFATAVGFDQFEDAGKADAKTLAKLAGFISRSASAQSAKAGSGSGSQPVTF